MADLLLAAGDHPFLPTALSSGLAGREIEFLDRIVARAAKVNPPRPEFAATAAILVEAVGREGSGRQLQDLVSRAGDSGGLPHWARLAVLQGLSRLVDSSSRGARAAGGPLNSAMLAPLTGSSDAEVRGDAGKLAIAIERAEALAQSRARFRPLTSDEQKRYEAGRATYLMCAACHQPTGTGLVNVAPSLVDSRWVGANPEVLARIVLDGKEGTPGFPSTMPPIGSALSDDQIAGVLTYVRNSWGLHYGGVSPDSVAKARRAVAGRGASWTDRSLELVAETLPP
jgi:mono/diheme cytochrome c family protein